MLSPAGAMGRLPWSSASDALGRKNMYRIYLGVGALMYLVVVLTTNARYTAAFSIMIGLLVVGFVCNELIRPVQDRFHEPERREHRAERTGPRT